MHPAAEAAPVPALPHLRGAGLWGLVRGSPYSLIFISDPVFSTSFIPVLFSFLSVVCVPLNT